MSEIDINRVVGIFANEMPQMDVCAIFTDASFDDFKMRIKESASDSEVLFATLINSARVGLNVDVALKVWLDWNAIPASALKVYEKNKNHMTKDLAKYIEQRLELVGILEGLYYEVNVYRFITENIIAENLSPNFIPILAYGMCKLATIKQHVYDRLNAQGVQQLEKFFKPLEVFPDLSLNIMITGTNKLNILSFKDVIKNKLPKHECASIMFQCLYSLLLLEYFKIAHNDLHLGNLLMEVLDTPVCLSFSVGRNKVSFKTQYIPKFYDWDRGFVASLGENPLLDLGFSLETHALNMFIPNRDYYQFMCEMSSYPDFWKVLDSIVLEPNYKAWRYKDEYGRAFDTNISHDSILRLKEYIKAYKKDAARIVVADAGYYVTMPQEDVLATLTPFEINTIFGEIIGGDLSLDKFKHSESVYFSTNKAASVITSLPGWNCQSLFIPNDSLLVNLPIVFGDADFFYGLTQHLDQCTAKEVSGECFYTFPE